MRLERNAETRQLVLWCMGEAHADVILDRLRTGGAEVETVPVRVPLRETFTATATGRGRHVKQSGGHGQYGICDIRVEPLPQGSGYEFASEVVGGAVPTNYIPSVDKGVRAQMEKGLIAGYPVVDIRVVVYDGKAHSVDSSDAAFQTAGSLALKAAAENGQMALLEPVDEVTIRVPEAYVGTIMGDLSGRRGRVQGTEPDPDHPDKTLVKAEVPARELLRYAIELRAMTSGAGTLPASSSATTDAATPRRRGEEGGGQRLTRSARGRNRPVGFIRRTPVLARFSPARCRSTGPPARRCGRPPP